MGLIVKDVPNNLTYFKPDDHMEAAAILFEVKDWKRQVPSGNFGPKDTAYADVTVFSSQESLDAGEPDLIQKNASIQATILARDLEDVVGAALIAQLGKSKPGVGKKPAFIFKQTNNDTKAKVSAYYDKREAELAAAVADAPSFD